MPPSTAPYICKAATYYGKHATGWVVVTAGGPYHCPGASGKADAQRMLAKLPPEVPAAKLKAHHAQT